MTSPTDLHDLPIELFGIISSHIVLPERPATLRSLALTSRRASEIVVPHLLYQHIILHDEERLVSVLDRLFREAGTRAAVRGIYIHALLVSGPDDNFPTITKLKALFELGGLAGVHTVDLRLWSYDGDHRKLCFLNPFAYPDSLFWAAVKKSCPGIRTLILDDVYSRGQLPGSTDARAWSLDDDFFQFRVRTVPLLLDGLTHFAFLQGITRLLLAIPPFKESACREMLEYIAVLSARLEMLHLHRKIDLKQKDKIRPRFWQGVLDLTFPNLESFGIEDKIHGQGWTLTATQFWMRHPKVSSVGMHIQGSRLIPSLFPSCEEYEGAPLLPRLQYLTVRHVLVHESVVLIVNRRNNLLAWLGSS
jgi:hypothetical protein